MVYVTSLVDLSRQITGSVCRLLAGEDVEVIVRRMSTRVAFGAYGRAKDDQVPVPLSAACVSPGRHLLGDACV